MALCGQSVALRRGKSVVRWPRREMPHSGATSARRRSAGRPSSERRRRAGGPPSERRRPAIGATSARWRTAIGATSARNRSHVGALGDRYRSDVGAPADAIGATSARNRSNVWCDVGPPSAPSLLSALPSARKSMWVEFFPIWRRVEVMFSFHLWS